MTNPTASEISIAVTKLLQQGFDRIRVYSLQQRGAIPIMEMGGVLTVFTPFTIANTIVDACQKCSNDLHRAAKQAGITIDGFLFHCKVDRGGDTNTEVVITIGATADPNAADAVVFEPGGTVARRKDSLITPAPPGVHHFPRVLN